MRVEREEIDGLAKAVDPVQSMKMLEFETLGECAKRCTDLKRAGCILAWIIVHATTIFDSHFSSMVADGIFTPGVWHRASKKRLALPLREGDLRRVRAALQPLSLDEAVGDLFVEQWAHEAWKMAAVTALNRMFGSNHPLEEGSWNKSELRVSRAIGLSIQRVMSHGAVHRPFS